MKHTALCILLVCYLSACASTPPAEDPPATLLYVQDGRVKASTNLGATATSLNFAPPAGCSIRSLHPAPRGAYLAILLDCAFGPLTVVADLAGSTSGSPLKEPVDNRFLAWSADGTTLYLLADALGETRLLQVNLRTGKTRRLLLPASTYAIACSPDSQTLAYTQTPGLGFGSELWLTDLDGRHGHRLLAEPAHIIALPRWSPDGQRLAYIRMPDSQTPFPEGELWLLDISSGQARALAAADAGRGYAPAWSPNGKFIAFTARETPGAQSENGNIPSQIHVLEAETGQRSDVIRLAGAQPGAPVWSPDSRLIVFPLLLDGKMNLWAYEIASNKTIPLTEAGACCPAWIGK